MKSSGLEVIGEHAPLASRRDILHSPELWMHEVITPFHLALIGKKTSD